MSQKRFYQAVTSLHPECFDKQVFVFSKSDLSPSKSTLILFQIKVKK